MNKSALQDIQQALNAIRSEIERLDDETKWAALELILGASSSVIALAGSCPVYSTTAQLESTPGQYGSGRPPACR